VFDAETGRRTLELLDNGGTIVGMAHDVDGRKLAVVSGDQVRVWDLALGYVRQVLPVPGVRSVAFSSNGSSIVVSGVSGIQVWNTEFPPFTVDFEAWQKKLAAFDLASNQVALALAVPKATLYDPRHAITQDGRLMAVAESDKRPELRDARTSEVLHQFQNAKPSLSVAVSPDGRFAATGSWSSELQTGDVRLWDLRSGSEIRRFVGHAHYAWSVAFSSDGTKLLSGGKSTMHLWDVSSGEEIRRFKVSFSFVKQVTFSPDGRLAVATDHSSPMDRQHVVFDTVSGDELLQFHKSPVEMMFSPQDILCDNRYGRWVRPLEVPQVRR
jgi:WD40 repeat protein